MSYYGNRPPYGRGPEDYDRPVRRHRGQGWRLAVAGALLYGALAYTDVVPSPADVVANNPQIARTVKGLVDSWATADKTPVPPTQVPRINAAVSVKAKVEKALESKPQLRVGQESYSAEVKFSKNPGVLDAMAYSFCVSKVGNGDICKTATDYILQDNLTYTAFGTVSACVNLTPESTTITTKNDPEKPNTKVLELEVDSATNCNPNDKVDLDTKLGKWNLEKGIVQRFLSVFGFDPLKMDITQSTETMQLAEDAVYVQACESNLFTRATEMGQEQLSGLTNGVLGQAMEEVRQDNPNAKIIGVSKIEVKMRQNNDNACGNSVGEKPTGNTRTMPAQHNTPAASER